ncbi:CheW domain protein [Thalassoporum mexicanum PCC 7367]|uniref:chemotaxis protein CheW n=1 Tax=Thalassoporum mexicanum TaxID=3457544 RepID=UPI00029FD0C3|nr:chemotaxis protein CheW [Pseudanabaena sp. PCC 7367]AFY68894.1 CheW domain protein [Pseudanabaena sp. PCC 7367]
METSSSLSSSASSPASSLGNKLQELLPSLFESTQMTGDAYLRFELTPGRSSLFSMEDVQESLLVPAENITLLPNMSAAVIGLMSSRDHVFCVVDLLQLVGLSPLSSYSRQYHVIVLRVSPSRLNPADKAKELLLGVAVTKIQGIARAVSDQVRSPEADFAPSLTPFLRGCVVAKDQELLILDTGAIVKQALVTHN